MASPILDTSNLDQSLDADLTPEERLALEATPFDLRRMMWGLIALVAFVSATIFITMQVREGRQIFEQQREMFTGVVRRAPQATPDELVAFSQSVGMWREDMRLSYQAGSGRRRELEGAHAAATLAVSTAILDQLDRRTGIDMADELALGVSLQGLLSDSIATGLARIQPAVADSLLGRLSSRATDAMVALAASGSGNDVLRASTLAEGLARLVPDSARFEYQELAMRLRSRGQEMMAAGGGLDDGGMSRRRQIAASLGTLLEQQGVPTTSVEAAGEGGRLLVLRGLLSSEQIGRPIVTSEGLRRRLQEAGFTTLQAHGVDAARAWGLSDGTPVPVVVAP